MIFCWQVGRSSAPSPLCLPSAWEAANLAFLPGLRTSLPRVRLQSPYAHPRFESSRLWRGEKREFSELLCDKP